MGPGCDGAVACIFIFNLLVHAAPHHVTRKLNHTCAALEHVTAHSAACTYPDNVTNEPVTPLCHMSE